MDLSQITNTTEGLRIIINSNEEVTFQAIPRFLPTRIRQGRGVIMHVGKNNVVYVKHKIDQKIAAYSESELELDGDGDPL